MSDQVQIVGISLFSRRVFPPFLYFIYGDVIKTYNPTDDDDDVKYKITNLKHMYVFFFNYTHISYIC